MRIIYRLSEELLASQERLSSTEFVSWPVVWLVGSFDRSFAGHSVSGPEVVKT